MNKQEFEQRINERITDNDYEIIEYIYTFHPSIDNELGKEQIATIYKIGGMRVIRDMVQTAKLAERIYNERRLLQHKLDQLKEIEKDLKSGEEMDMNLVVDILES